MARSTIIALLFIACASRSITHDALAGEVELAVETLTDPAAPPKARQWAMQVLEKAPEKISRAGRRDGWSQVVILACAATALAVVVYLKLR